MLLTNEQSLKYNQNDRCYPSDVFLRPPVYLHRAIILVPLIMTLSQGHPEQIKRTVIIR